MNMQPDDPRLTAYALDELDDAERAEIELLLKDNEEARAEVEAIRATAHLLAAELAHEPEAELAPEQREHILATSAKPRTISFARRWLPRLAVAGISFILVACGVMLVLARQAGVISPFTYSLDGGPPMAGTPQRGEQRDVSQKLALLKPQGQMRATDAVPPPAPTPAPPPMPPSQPAPAESVLSAPASITSSGTPAEEKTPLNVQVPKPMFIGTPRNIKSPNLERYPGEGDPRHANDAQGNAGLPQNSGNRGGISSGNGGYGGLLHPAPASPVQQRTQLGTEARPIDKETGEQLRALGYTSTDINGNGDVELYQAYIEAKDVWGPPLHQTPAPGTETYAQVVENRFTIVSEEPLSTFSIDVDTASYANVRRFLNDGTFPPKDAVRIEELVNYFKYDYPQPRGDSPFAVNVEMAACPWNEAHTLARIGLKGKVPPTNERPRCNLVFLLDISGSMGEENKLPLLKKGMKMLSQELRGNDLLGIVTYCTDAQVALESVPCDRRNEILGVLYSLSAGGSTNGGAGIREAYDMAMRHFIKGGINRVILATDGDFNTGLTTKDEFVNLIQQAAKSGVFLSVLGFGTGNLKDTNLEALADKGNGHYAYIDSFNEARKVLLEQAGGTLETIAKDVKIQIEFNPAKVGAYRLVGYENRVMAAKDFNDDRKDAGEIGAGHTVTALYELVPPGQPISTPGVDALKYQANPKPPAPPVSDSNDLMTVKLRYKHPESDTSARADIPVPAGTTHAPSPDFKFAAAVAEFGMLLRGSENDGSATFQQALELAEQGKGADPEGYRSEFLNLVKTAAALANQPIVASAATPERVVKTPAEDAPAPAESTAVAPPPAPPAAPTQEELAPLKLVLPKPMFVGTPRNIVSPNLETPTGRPRQPFMAPKDVTNVALGKPVTASDAQPIIGDLAMLTDGDKEGADGSFVEFAPGVQWEQVDLDARHEIFAIVLWHYHSQSRVYHDVIVQVSDDPNFVKNVTTVYNNDHDNSAGLGIGADKEYIETSEGRLIDCKGVKGRYVRAYSRGNTSNDMNHMIEIEVYGRPVK